MFVCVSIFSGKYIYKWTREEKQALSCTGCSSMVSSRRTTIFAVVLAVTKLMVTLLLDAPSMAWMLWCWTCCLISVAPKPWEVCYK